MNEPEFLDTLLIETLGLPAEDPFLAALSGYSLDHRKKILGLVTEIRYHMFQDPTWSTTRADKLRTWFDQGTVGFDGQIYHPREIFGDEKLVSRALSEVYEVTR
jgi:hypothetical protein